MKMIPKIAAVSVVSILALSSAVYADNNFGDDGHRSQSERNFGSHPVDPATKPPGPAQAKGHGDPVKPEPDPSDQHREGREACADPSNCK